LQCPAAIGHVRALAQCPANTARPALTGSPSLQAACEWRKSQGCAPPDAVGGARQRFREPLYLTDRPLLLPDTRTDEQRRFPELFPQLALASS